MHSHEAALKMSILLGSPVKRGISKVPSFPVSSLPLGISLAVTRKQRQGKSPLHLGDTAESLQRCLELLSPTLGARHRMSGRHKDHSPLQLRNTTTCQGRPENSRLMIRVVNHPFSKGCHLCECPIIHITGALAKSH